MSAERKRLKNYFAGSKVKGMKQIVPLLFFFALVARSYAIDSFKLTYHPPFDTNSISANAQMLLATLKPGMTRAQLDKHFRMDAGPMPHVVERHYLEDNLAGDKVIKMEIVFRPAEMDEATFADPKKQASWFRTRDWFNQDWRTQFQPNDIVVAIGTPYLEVPITD